MPSGRSQRSGDRAKGQKPSRAGNKAGTGVPDAAGVSVELPGLGFKTGLLVPPANWMVWPIR